jgi:DNA-binding FrmR family transcriptional regulator
MRYQKYDVLCCMTVVDLKIWRKLLFMSLIAALCCIYDCSSSDIYLNQVTGAASCYNSVSNSFRNRRAMQLSSVLAKTAKGLEEIDKRTYKLNGRLRAVMFMIDGQRTAEDLLNQAGSLASQLETQLNELLAQGFIEELHADLPEATQPLAPITAPVPPPAPANTAPSAPAVALASSATTVAPITVPKPIPAREQLTPIPVVKARLGKMLSETMGMRAMFISSQLESLNTIMEISQFSDETARSHATSAGAKAAEQWRTNAREIAGL